MEKLTLLIDADVYAYQASVASEHAIQWDDEVHTLDANLEEAKASFDDRIAQIKEKLEATDVVMALSYDVGSGYWRRRVLPSYKMNRKASRKPLCLIPLRNYVIEKYDAKLKPMLEGDDVLGILATHPTLIKGKKMIVSIDKDMKTIPGLFCRILDGREEMYDVSPDQADYWHMFQTLTGDTTDGYKGCPGTGPVAAAKILDVVWATCATSERWPAVVAAYAKKGLGEEAALVQARVARILRYTDYDFKTKLPILWNPPAKGTKINDETTITTQAPDEGVASTPA